MDEAAAVEQAKAVAAAMRAGVSASTSRGAGVRCQHIRPQLFWACEALLTGDASKQ